jgi:ABC-2 type transport system permease protein
MTVRVTRATARRVLEQLRRDRRSLALIVIVPPALLALLRYILDAERPAFQRVAVPLVGMFPLIIMFLITSITMLRERTSGTLERLMSLPLAKLDLIAGYAVAFAFVAAVQTCVTSAVAFGLLGVTVHGSAALVVALAVTNALLGVALGLFLSAFATSEFQAVQFMPAVLLPQILLSGLFVPHDRMPHALRIAADALPLAYGFDALARVGGGNGVTRLELVVAVVLGTILVAVALGATTLRRRTP